MAIGLLQQPLTAQSLLRTAVTGYTVDNGLLQNSVGRLVVDKFGFVWFGSSAGLQRFDGQHFETVKLPHNSITSYTAPNLNLLQNNELWISHAGGISIYNPETNRLRTAYNQPPSLLNYLYKFVGEDAASVWYITHPQGLLRFDKASGRLLKKEALPPEMELFGYGFECKPLSEHRVVIALKKALWLFDLQQQKFTLLYTGDNWVSGFVPLNPQTIVYSQGGIFYQLNTHTGTNRLVCPRQPGMAPTDFIEMLLTKDGRLLAGIGKNIYELDTASLKIKTKYATFNQANLLQSGYISRIYLDRFDRLWVLTNSDGVKKINIGRQPFTYYGTANRELNFTRCIYVNKQKARVLAGTYDNGLLVFDTAGNLLRHIAAFANGAQTVLDIKHLKDNDYLLLTMGDQSLCLFNSETGKTTVVSGNKKVSGSIRSSYYGSLHQLSATDFLMADHSFLRFTLAHGRLTDTATLRPFGDFPYNFCLTKNGDYCIATSFGLEFTDTAFRQKRFVPFPQTIINRCMAEDAAGNLWLATDNGLYKFNGGGAFLKQYRIADGLTDEGIYAIRPAGDGIYFSHNKGLSFLSGGGEFRHYTRYAGLQENEFNTKSGFATPDGQLFFGGINGVSAFYHRQLSFENEPPAVYITGLEVMNKPWRDTAVWNIRQLDLDYTEAHIALRIGVPAATDNDGYVYEYKMEGVESEWIPTSGTDFIRYVLQPGNYHFKVRISHLQKVAAETSLLIHVTSPFWQQTWFTLLAAAMALSVIAFVFHRYTRNKYLKRIKRLEMEQHLQTERERISRDLHDNLGAYASAIADNVDKVIKNPGDGARLKSLKDNAAEIMNNLRDTIWALNKASIGVVTLSDRIKAYLQKMREAYPTLAIHLEENTDTRGTGLSPEHGLNVLRIVQEALHNAIKHSKGTDVFITLNIGPLLYISIRDNGIGLGANGAVSGNGFGNMKVRAKEANLQLRFRSSKSEGTLVELFSPVQ